MLPYLRAANVKDGALDLADVKEMNFSPAEQGIFSLAPGDVLVTEGSGSLGTVGASAVWRGEIEGTVCFQNTLLRLRPRTGTDTRFLAWWCRYAFSDGLFASVATGANIFHLSAERVRALAVSRVDSERQRAIADFLDVETARIDALIAKKRQLVKLVQDRWVRHVVDMTEESDAQERPSLRRLVEDVIGGAWGDEPGCAELDALCIRGTDFDTDRLAAKPDGAPTRAFKASELRRRVLSANDLVIEKSGGGENQPVGRVVQWQGDATAVPTNFAARLRPAANVHSRYLAYALRSAYESGLTRAWVNQTTGIQNLDLGGLLSERWWVPSVARQAEIAAELDRATGLKNQTVEALRHQIALLQEHRQALITAAVTGDLEVPGLAA